MASNETRTFKESYNKLKSILEEFKNNPEIDIDDLIAKSEIAVNCIKQCSARLEAATKKLDSIFQETNVLSDTKVKKDVPF